MTAGKQSQRREEDALQKSVVHLLRMVLPRSSIIHHSRNEGNRGGKRGIIDGQRAKAMGQFAGFADLILIHGGQVYFIELKTKGGRMASSQRNFRTLVEDQGLPYALCRSVDEVRAVLADWGVAA